MTGNNLAYGLVYLKVVGRTKYDQTKKQDGAKTAIPYTDYAYLYDKFNGSKFHSDLSLKYLNRFY